MNLINWTPFGETDDLYDRLIGNVFRPSGLRVLGAETQWRPAADIFETEKEYSIKLDLPDVKKKDVDVSARYRESQAQTASNPKRFTMLARNASGLAYTWFDFTSAHGYRPTRRDSINSALWASRTTNSARVVMLSRICARMSKTCEGARNYNL